MVRFHKFVLMTTLLLVATSCKGPLLGSGDPTTFRLTYDKNGATTGSVPFDGKGYSSGDSAIVKNNNGSLSKPGFAFVSWGTLPGSGGVTYLAGDSILFSDSNITLYAQWQSTYSITYLPNGADTGNAPVDTTGYLNGAPATILGNSDLQKAGYGFVGWNSTSLGDGVPYAPNSTVTMGAQNITLYAQWSPTTSTTYHLTYDLNGGTGITPVDSTAYAQGSGASIPAYAGDFSLAGYTFAGWDTLQGGNGAHYNPPTSILMTADTTLYAQWAVAPSVTVTYSANGATTGTAPVDSASYSSGATATVLPNSGLLGRPGVAFASGFTNWNTSPTGMGTSYWPGDTITLASSNVTLYAQWGGTVSTYAGAVQVTGYTDGPVAAARFWNPSRIVQTGGVLYVSDMSSRRIRKIDLSTDTVSTLAGNTDPNAYGSADGVPGVGTFWDPYGLATDGSYLYVADMSANKIRKVDLSTGYLSTLAGSGSYATVDGNGASASINEPRGITYLGGNLYVVEMNGGYAVRKINVTTGDVTTIAGGGTTGFVDGYGAAAQFYYPGDITNDGTNLYIADTNNHTIRMIRLTDNYVSTLIGVPKPINYGAWGNADGPASSASLSLPTGITFAGGCLYTSDIATNTIRKLDLATMIVSTFAGLNQNMPASVDGAGSIAQFFTPDGMVMYNGKLYVIDQQGATIRIVQ